MRWWFFHLLFYHCHCCSHLPCINTMLWVLLVQSAEYCVHFCVPVISSQGFPGCMCRCVFISLIICAVLLISETVQALQHAFWALRTELCLLFSNQSFISVLSYPTWLQGLLDAFILLLLTEFLNVKLLVVYKLFDCLLWGSIISFGPGLKKVQTHFI